MFQQLQQISKTIPLITNDQHYNTLCLLCPSKVLLLEYCNQYIIKAQLTTKLHKNTQQGIFSNFNIHICLSNHSSYYLSVKKSNNHHQPCFKNSQPINISNYQQFIIKEEGQLKTTFKSIKDFDLKIISLITSLKQLFIYTQIDLKTNKFLIRSNQDVWQIPIQCTTSGQQKYWYENLSTKDNIDMIKTQQFLNKIPNKNQQHSRNTHINPPNEQKDKYQTKQLPKKQLPESTQQLRQQLIKSTIVINKMLEQLTTVKNTPLNSDNKIQIQQNKLIKLINDLQEISKQNSSTVQSIIPSPYQSQQSFLSIHDEEELPIDFCSNTLNKFEINGSQVKYIGQDKQTTLLVSSKHYQSTTNKHLKTKLKILHTKSKCIKFGLMDIKSINQSLLWNSLNIIYLHGWGHTMINGHQKIYNLCDFGTGDLIQMNVYFDRGQLSWKINNKEMIFIQNEEIKNILRNVQIWAPFIAMYNCEDKVQWKISKIQ